MPHSQFVRADSAVVLVVLYRQHTPPHVTLGSSIMKLALYLTLYALVTIVGTVPLGGRRKSWKFTSVPCKYLHRWH